MYEARLLERPRGRVAGKRRKANLWQDNPRTAGQPPNRRGLSREPVKASRQRGKRSRPPQSLKLVAPSSGSKPPPKAAPKSRSASKAEPKAARARTAKRRALAKTKAKVKTRALRASARP